MPRAKWLQNIHPRVKHLITDSSTGISALDKPVGILSHPNGIDGINRSIITSKYDFTEEAFNIEYTKNNDPDPITCIEKLYLLNRLDSATSGVILVSTNKKTNIAIKKSFAQRNQISKCYYAVSFVNPQITHKIKNMIGRELMWSNKMKLQKHEENDEQHVRAKASSSYHSNKRSSLSSSFSSSSTTAVKKEVTCETQATILQYIPSHKYSQLPIVLLKLTPITGYTHQLRFQCAQHDFCIVGDKVYGDFDKNKVFMKAIRNHVNNYSNNDTNATTTTTTTKSSKAAVSSSPTLSMTAVKTKDTTPTTPFSSNADNNNSSTNTAATLLFNRMYLHSHSIQVSFDHTQALLNDADNNMIDSKAAVISTTTSSSTSNAVVALTEGKKNDVHNYDNNNRLAVFSASKQRSRNDMINSSSNSSSSSVKKTFTAVSPLPAVFCSPLIGFTLPLIITATTTVTTGATTNEDSISASSNTMSSSIAVNTKVAVSTAKTISSTHKKPIQAQVLSSVVSTSSPPSSSISSPATTTDVVDKKPVVIISSRRHKLLSSFTANNMNDDEDEEEDEVNNNNDDDDTNDPSSTCSSRRRYRLRKKLTTASSGRSSSRRTRQRSPHNKLW